MRALPAASAAIIVLTMSRLAFAQGGLPGPLVDVGVDGSLAVQQGLGQAALAPRLTLHPSALTALTIRVDAAVSDQRGQGSRVRSQRFVVELHRTFATLGPMTVDGIAGAGVHRGRYAVPAFGDRVGSEVATPGTRELVRIGPAWTMGLGTTERVGTRLLLRQDFRLAVHDDGPDAVMSVGLAVPLGQYVARRSGQVARLDRGSLRTGMRVWITDARGDIVTGVVGDVNATTVEVVQPTGRRSIAFADARRVEVPDSIRDGLRNGAIAGGIGFGIYGAFVGQSLCECDDDAVGVAVAIAAYGAAGGALVGALSDSLHVGRRVLVERSGGDRSVGILPVLTRHGVGAAAIVRW
jgi:hypothetical protein